MTRVQGAPLRASPCTLAWNLISDPAISGYRLYYGLAGSATTNRLDVGLTNLATLNTLLASSNYVFYVVAYNSSGIESAPSGRMYYTPRALSALKLTALVNGSISLRFLAATGATCHVEYTPSLNPPRWQTLTNTTADVNGNVTVSDPLRGSTPMRFYRSALP